MADGGNQPPLDQRKRREGLRTVIPRSAARRDSSTVPPIEVTRSRSHSRIRVKKVTSETSIPQEESDVNLAASVAESTPGVEASKRPRSDGSSPDSPTQGDGSRPPRKYQALPAPPMPLPDTPQPSTSESLTEQPSPATLPIATIQPPASTLPAVPQTTQALPSPLKLTVLPPQRRTYAVKTQKDVSNMSFRQHLSIDMPQSSSCVDGQQETQVAGCSQESECSSRDSTNYAELVPTVERVQLLSRPPSPQPGPSGISYAAAATAQDSHSAHIQNQQNAVPRPTQRLSAYPPITVERLPNWTSHFNILKERIGHAPNARPMGKGVRFLPGSEQEFRIIQRYLSEASHQDKTISWFCYSPPSEIPTKVAVRGLPLDTPPDEVVAALQEIGFPATRAKAILPTKSRHGCTYFVQLDHLNKEQLQVLYGIKELLCMPGVTVEAWKPGRSPAQCHRCQAFGHASDNCHRPQRCVRCAGEHLARDCTKPAADPPKCANCGKAHTARDRKCAVLRKEARKRGINLAPLRPIVPQSGRQIGRRPSPNPRSTAAPTHEAPHQAASDEPAQVAPKMMPSATIHNSRQMPPATSSSEMPTTAPSAPLHSIQQMDVEQDSIGKQTITTTQVIPAVVNAGNASPSTLAPPANPPTERGQPLPGKKKNKKKRNREPRPITAQPTASSTLQPRPVPTVESEHRERTMPQPQPQTEVIPPPLTQAQDFTPILRAIIEAITVALTTYTQGQGLIPAVLQGLTLIARAISR